MYVQEPLPRAPSDVGEAAAVLAREVQQMLVQSSVDACRASHNTPIFHSHVENDCAAREMSAALRHGGMLNYGHSEFTMQNNLSNKFNAEHLNSAIAVVSV